MREVLQRRFGLVENQHFQLHPHRGRGQLPHDLLSPPDRTRQGLLDQLPAKLRGWSWLGAETCVLVVLDVDKRPCAEVLAELNAMLHRLLKRPPHVMFRLAIEETESWFLADEKALTQAFPKLKKVQRPGRVAPDAIVGAWEVLARSIGVPTQQVTGADKFAWAERIAPYLDLENPPSPSLRKLIQGIQRELERESAR